MIAPLGIVLYNVFGKGGPSLYGMKIKLKCTQLAVGLILESGIA